MLKEKTSNEPQSIKELEESDSDGNNSPVMNKRGSLFNNYKYERTPTKFENQQRLEEEKGEQASSEVSPISIVSPLEKKN